MSAFTFKSDDTNLYHNWETITFTREELEELLALARRKIAKNKKLARKAEKESCRRDQYERD